MDKDQHQKPVEPVSPFLQSFVAGMSHGGAAPKDVSRLPARRQPAVRPGGRRNPRRWGAVDRAFGVLRHRHG